MNKLIKEVTKTEVVSGVIYTDGSDAALTVKVQKNKQLLIHFGSTNPCDLTLANSQFVTPRDLRQLSVIFLELANALDNKS